MMDIMYNITLCTTLIAVLGLIHRAISHVEYINYEIYKNGFLITTSVVSGIARIMQTGKGISIN